MTDQFILQDSYDVQEREVVDWSVTQKRFMRVQDTANSGSYPGSNVVFDLSTVSNSGKFLSLADSTVTFPVNIEVTRPDGSAPVKANRFLACLKNNHAIVDSISATLSNMPVIQSQKMNPARVAYSLATNWSQDDYARAGRFGIAWEDGTKHKINATNTCFGTKGVSNTSVLDYSASADDMAKYMAGVDEAHGNKGRKARCESVRYPDAKLQTYKTDSASMIERQSFMVNEATKQVFHINVTCSLAHLDDFFKRAPMSRNGLWRIEFFLNLASMNIVIDGGESVVGAGTAIDKTYKSVETTTSNGFNPISLGALQAGDGTGPMEASDKSMVVKMAIGNDMYPTGCHMDLALYDLAPFAQKAYLAEPVKTWEYEKCLYQHVGSVPKNGFKNLLLSNGTSRARKLVILPYYVNGDTKESPSDLLSPFSSFGSSTLSGLNCTITDFQVTCSGQPLFQTPLKENALEYYDRFKQWTLNNGHDSAEINSSAVSLEQYKSLYGAIVIDLTKHDQSEDDLSKSYAIEFRNNTEQVCSYLTMIYYSATISQNVESGIIIV